MCNPALIQVGLAVGTALFSSVQKNQEIKAQKKAVDVQNALQQKEIADQAGQELTERARAARRERGIMRASASESGINLGSNSFLAALQTSMLNQFNDQGLITQNEKNAQKARDASATSILAGLSAPNAFGTALQIGISGAGAYYNTKAREKAGSDRAVSGN
jgi:hypothetical protein